jgi:activator of 2-hydroxyglutaryl-CoA dehydratase
VFSESEVVSLINEGRPLPDIITGINNAVAGRVCSMARRVGIVEDLALTGGCSKNDGLVKALEKQTGVNVKRLPADPQLVGAIGAALFACEKAKQEEERVRQGSSEERKKGGIAWSQT